MAILPLYHWDFNRIPADRDPAFLTMSIAIFQWLPKTSGKGLKKVNACRVCGYMFDPRSVYAKAQEICDKLNAAGASANSPPDWLQKQYSVPKPKALVDPRVARDLPGSVVRSIRLNVMKRMLLPEGFVKGKQGTYVRRQGDQIHLIDFQAARFGHEYVVNLGFHYAFLQPLFANRKIKLTDYCQLDCGLRARTGIFTKSGRDQWFEYGTDRARLEKTLEQNARDCLGILSNANEHFAVPQRLLRGSACSLNQHWIDPWQVHDKEFARLLGLYLGRRAIPDCG